MRRVGKKKAGPIKSTIIVMIFGLSFIGTSIVCKTTLIPDLGDYEEVVGEVTGYERYKDSEGDTMYHTEYTYEVDGHTYEVMSSSGISSRPVVGKSMDVCYNVENPEISALRYELELIFLVSNIFKWIGIAIIAIGLIGIVKNVILFMLFGAMAFQKVKARSDIRQQQDLGYKVLREQGLHTQILTNCPFCNSQIIYKIPQCPNCRQFLSWPDNTYEV